MRATIKNYLDAAKQRREDGEAGFSLIELIVVVAILGILVAVAIPVFANIQDTAKANTAKAAAANGATAVAAAIANGTTSVDTVETTVLDKMSKDGIELTFVVPATGTALTLDNYCVRAVGGSTQTAGPACTAPTPAS